MTTTRSTTVFATATATASTAGFLIHVDIGANVQRKGRRALDLNTNAYVGESNGVLQLVEKSHALEFQIDKAGHLSSGGKYVSATLSDVEAGQGTISLLGDIGEISQIFSVDSVGPNQILRWRNARFTGDGLASFCASNNEINGVFREGSDLADCDPITLFTASGQYFDRNV